MKKKSIKKVYQVPDIIISGSILLFGLLFTFAMPSLEWLGIILLITAAFMIPFYKTGYKIESQKEIFQKKDILLPHECKNQIAEYMEGRSENLDLDPFKQGGLLLEWYYTKDRAKQFGQIFDYEGNKYTAQSKLSELSQKQVETLLKYQS